MAELTVIAGCGYLGSALAHQLLQQGRQVLGLTRQQDNAIALQNQGIAAVPCDLTDEAAVQRAARIALASAPSSLRIILCAAAGRGGGLPDYTSIYLGGSRNLRVAFPHWDHFVFTSSTSVYPQTDGQWVTESSGADPARGTGQILKQVEMETVESGGSVVRLAGIYGPGRSVLLRQFLSDAAHIELVPGEGPDSEGRWINQIHVQDAAAALIHITDRVGSLTSPAVWNVADSNPWRQRQLYAALSKRFPHIPQPPPSPPDLQRKRGWTHKRVSNEKLRSTGWQPTYPSWFDALDAGAIFSKSLLEDIRNERPAPREGEDLLSAERNRPTSAG